MIIEKRWLVKFKDVIPGNVFEYNGRVYMRILQISTLDCDGRPEIIGNAINLYDGGIEDIDYDEDVTSYEKAKVVINE